MNNQSLSRRNFLKTTGLTLAAATLTCSGLGYAVTRPPDIKTPELELRKDPMEKNKILVAYATRAGSTAEIAAVVGENLCQYGFVVDVKAIKDKPELNDYQAVILGSAIRMANWLPEALDFIKTNQQILQNIPVALFTVHMLNTGDDDDSRANRLAYLDKVRPMLNAPEEIFFAGKLDFSQLSFMDRLISRLVKAVEADYRDWEMIRNWTPAVSEILKGELR